jgi:hypothetical protein
MSTTSLILDFESLDTDPHAVITEFACIAVNRADFTHFDLIHRRISVLPQLADGRTFTADTIRWHEKKGTLDAASSGKSPLKETILELVDFIAKHNPHRIWAWGKDFERPLFENACKQFLTQLPPYQYRKFACGRDKWQDAFGMDFKEPARTHSAKQDCLDELRDIHAALTKLNLTHVF